jgi:hypothetical protein
LGQPPAMFVAWYKWVWGAGYLAVEIHNPTWAVREEAKKVGFSPKQGDWRVLLVLCGDQKKSEEVDFFIKKYFDRKKSKYAETLGITTAPARS